MYIITKEELEELLRKQRELCAEEIIQKHGFGYDYPILSAPSPPLPVNKESVIDWEGLETDCEEWCHRYSSTPWPSIVIQWIKTNLPNYIK